MVFHTISEVDNFIHSLVYLGQGSQGVCYRDKDSKFVYKFYHSYFVPRWFRPARYKKFEKYTYTLLLHYYYTKYHYPVTFS